MKKVKLTKEQAEAMEYAKKHHNNRDLINAYMKRSGCSFTVGGKLNILNNLDYDEFFGSLYDGYEVKYKPGDWAVSNNHARNSVGFIEKAENGIYEGFWIDLDTKEKEEMICGGTAFKRHANDTEIKQAKAIDFWLKNGREYWELKPKDILRYKNLEHAAEVTKVDKLNSEYIVELSNGHCGYLENVKENFEVVCFVQDRKDV